MPHLYFDQGGIFGNATYLITDNELPPHENDNHISNFYYCEANRYIIHNILLTFNKAFPECKTTEVNQ